ncbi:MAG: aldo/keto reductase [Phycisphaerales bacterium]|jgi:aryl-alcohol dehydrogenase-like predicted oxidoreductase
MPLTDYITLGRSGLRVSPFCLGTMTFGKEWGWGSDVETSNEVIRTFLDAGGNFLDTANMYTKGHSEVVIGDYFDSGPGKGNRDRVVIATKFLGNMYPGDPNGGGASRKTIYESCEQSLRRLKTDYIDLYWMHFHDKHTPLDETMRALDDLVRSGKVRYIGFSDTPAWRVVQAQYEAIFRGWNPLIALQIEYSLLERTVEHDLMPMAREMGLGVTPWSPIKGGILSGKYTRENTPKEGEGRYDKDSKHLSERTFKIIDALIEIGDAHDVSAAQVAFKWVQDRDGVASTIIGARKLDQLKDNMAAIDLELSGDETRRLDELSEPDPIFPHSFLAGIQNAIQGGTTVNGVESETPKMAPQNDDERW